MSWIWGVIGGVGGVFCGSLSAELALANRSVQVHSRRIYRRSIYLQKTGPSYQICRRGVLRRCGVVPPSGRSRSASPGAIPPWWFSDLRRSVGRYFSSRSTLAVYFGDRSVISVITDLQWSTTLPLPCLLQRRIGLQRSRCSPVLFWPSRCAHWTAKWSVDLFHLSPSSVGGARLPSRPTSIQGRAL